MMFNDTTNKSGLIQSFEFWTGQGDTTVSGNTGKLKVATRLLNKNYHKAVSIILDSLDGWDFDDPNHADTGFIKTFDLTASTQYVNIPVSNKILKVKRVEVAYDGTNWYKAAPMNEGEYYDAISNTSATGSNFETTKPFYYLVGNYVYLFPIPSANRTGGLKLWVTREVDEFTTTDTTQEPGFDEPFHEIISIGAARDYAFAKGLSSAQTIAAEYADLEARMRRHYGKKEDERHVVLKPNPINYN